MQSCSNSIGPSRAKVSSRTERIGRRYPTDTLKSRTLYGEHSSSLGLGHLREYPPMCPRVRVQEEHTPDGVFPASGRATCHVFTCTVCPVFEQYRHGWRASRWYLFLYTQPGHRGSIPPVLGTRKLPLRCATHRARHHEHMDPSNDVERRRRCAPDSVLARSDATLDRAVCCPSMFRRDKEKPCSKGKLFEKLLSRRTTFTHARTTSHGHGETFATTRGSVCRSEGYAVETGCAITKPRRTPGGVSQSTDACPPLGDRRNHPSPATNSWFGKHRGEPSDGSSTAVAPRRCVTSVNLVSRVDKNRVNVVQRSIF